MLVLLSFFLFGCVDDSKPQTDEDCVVFFDKCESGCEPVCGTISQRDDVNSGDVCDLGCMDSGLDDASCVVVDEACQWAE